MAAKCQACGETISTWQEVSTVLTKNWKIIRDSVAGNLKDLLKTITVIVAKFGAVGAVAGPMNAEGIPCPYCGSTERWTDI